MTTRFIPKAIEEQKWKKLEPGKNYAVRCKEEEEIRVRLGTGIGLYFSFSIANKEKLLIHSIGYDTGETTILASAPRDIMIAMGRAEECEFKIKHAIVSRRHAEFKLDGDIFVIKDNVSTNGTYIYDENVMFDVDEYLAAHPVAESANSTMDYIHEEFGPTLDDFLTRYQKGKQS